MPLPRSFNLQAAATIVCLVTLLLVTQTEADTQSTSNSTPTHLWRKLLQRGDEASSFRRPQRSLAQSNAEDSATISDGAPVSSSNSEADVPAPLPEDGVAPAPSTPSTPPPPPVSPFQPNATNACFCRDSFGGIYQVPYRQPTPMGCCCGSRESCGVRSPYRSLLCGGGQGCSILMLIASLVGVCILGFCFVGALYKRRRRRFAEALAAAGAPGPDGFGGVTGAPGRRPAVEQLVSIPPEQIASLQVKSPPPLDDGESTGYDNNNTTTTENPLSAISKECPICLENKNVVAGQWTIFPCSHGCCAQCFSDLLRHSSRPLANDRQTLAVLCPLCRKLAVAPAPASQEGQGAAAGDATAAAAPEAAAPETRNADSSISFIPGVRLRL